MASMTPFRSAPATGGQDRLARIGHARQAVLYGDPLPAGTEPLVENWIERSWLRCLAQGHRPEQVPSFAMVSAAALRRTLEANHQLVQAARPVLEKLGQAIADTRYFAILANQAGVVINVNGPIDRRDWRADMITRIGTDLSEQQVGTTAIGAALTELQPVWLHRGEHFFDATSVYSCAGAPLFGPDGRCAGMLDLTGIEAAERPELKHLVAQSARSIENALTLASPHALLVRLNWPGRTLGDESDGLVCVDADGGVTGANQAARQMVSQLGHRSGAALHCNDLFAMPFEMLFDAAQRQAPVNGGVLEVPLWTGLRLHATAQLRGRGPLQVTPSLPPSATASRTLKELETALIHKAVSDARGNVLQAARALGVSRATVYRRLGSGKRS
ncbi:helix-turn-helix domain-containing protein [Polaromonas aquatica]|uniref:helix-turn-helix domain-containing protein n=1 Tax=Polaromonas aquatica TaxID=332657 RepID=UPI003D64774C